MSQDLLKEIRNNPNYKSFLAIVETVSARIDIEGATKEALALHSARLSRALHGEKRYSPKAIVDANMQDIANRARLVEIRVKHDKQLSLLKSAIDAMRRHISTEYSADLRDFSTVEQRRAFVDRVLKSPVQLHEEGVSMLETLDSLIKDLDQASHAMRHIVALLQMVQDKSRGI
jgi:hypothetical protein